MNSATGVAGNLLRALQWLPQQLTSLVAKPSLGLPATRISQTAFGDRAYITAGSGTPTVVFESGLGDGKEVWAPVFRALSRHSRVLAYDRAGYGESAGSDLPRNGRQMVEELRALLQTENFPAPYILVGHSLGGTLVKLFVRMYPAEVAGVVLVDARAADFTKRCRHVGVRRFLYEPPVSWLWWGGQAKRRELEAVPLIQQQARRAGAFPHVPLIVLTHGKVALHWPKVVTKIWAMSQHSMSRMSRLGRIRVCDDSGHHVHRDRPDLVARAVWNVVNAVRDARALHKSTE
jgi:pimeloyl-ACP methyl ester carboxylesterase